jgi:hypothetical protein
LSWNFPDGQWKHVIDRTHALYLPELQSTQACRPSWWYRPIGQSVQLPDPATANEPSTQLSHAIALYCVEYLPAGHTEHPSALESVNHASIASSDVSLYLPGMHAGVGLGVGLRVGCGVGLCVGVNVYAGVGAIAVSEQ